MSPHDSTHEALVQRIITGEIDVAQDEVQALLSTCKVCETELQDMQRLSARLDGAGCLEREVLDAAALEARGLINIKDVLANSMRPRVETIPLTKRRPIFPQWLKAAAVVLLALGLWKFGPWHEAPPPNPSGEITLGADKHLVLEAPTGTVRQFGKFRWRYQGRAVAFTLVVMNLEEIELARYETTESVFEPPTTDREAWPQIVLWNVTAVNTDGSRYTPALPERAQRL